MPRKPKPGDYPVSSDAPNPDPAQPPAKAVAWADWPVQEIPLAQIHEHGHTHRLPAGAGKDPALELLAKTIREHGLQHPILVYERGPGEGYDRVFGSRRCAAFLANGRHAIPARVMPHVPTEEEIQDLRAIENFARQDLNAAEKAVAAVEMVESKSADYSRDQAIVRTAATLTASEAWVRDCLYIVARLTAETREYLAAGSVNLGQARALAKVGDPKVQREFAKRIADDLAPPKTQYSANAGRGGRVVSVAEIEGWIQTSQRSLRIIPWNPAEPMRTGVPGCNACVGCAHNTATDTTLFGTSKEEAANGGFCMHAAGYAAKERLTAQAIAGAQAKIAGALKAKSIDREEARSIETVRAALPAFVKEANAQRKIVAELGLAPAGSKAAAKKPAEKKQDPRVVALCLWGKKYQGWDRKLWELVQDAALRSPAKILCLLALQATNEWKDRPEFDLPNEYASKPATAPPVEEPMGAPLSTLLDYCEKNNALAIAGAVTMESLDGYERNFTVGPELAAKVARVFGAKVDPPPVYSPPEAAAAAEEAAPKAKGAKRPKGGPTGDASADLDDLDDEE